MNDEKIIKLTIELIKMMRKEKNVMPMQWQAPGTCNIAGQLVELLKNKNLLNKEE